MLECIAAKPRATKLFGESNYEILDSEADQTHKFGRKSHSARIPNPLLYNRNVLAQIDQQYHTVDYNRYKLLG